MNQIKYAILSYLGHIAQSLLGRTDRVFTELLDTLEEQQAYIESLEKKLAAKTTKKTSTKKA